jgi:hypothetical protein
MMGNDDAPKQLPHITSVEIPLDWSPQQALAAYEWLEQLRTRIWLLYGADIQQFLRNDLVSTSQLPNHTDDPPF